MAGVAVVLRDRAGTVRATLPQTCRDGWTQDVLEAEPFQAEVLFRRAGVEEPARILLGEVVPKMEETAEEVLRLPPEGLR